MGRNILKNTGRIILTLVFIFACSRLYAVEVQTELSPSKIAAGESASLRIKITGESADVKPVKFPAVKGLTITFSGQSRNFNFINGKTWAGTVISFSIYSENKGVYKIPPFILETDGQSVASKEVTLTVGDPVSNRGGGGLIRGDVELSSDTVYTGEPFIMHYVIYGGEGDAPEVEGFTEQPHAKGFVMKILNGEPSESGKTFAGSFCLVPVDKGVHEIGGASVVVSVDVSRDFFSMSKRKKVIFPYKKINVIPIPAEGKPEHFTGDVGEFKIDAQLPPGKFKVFDEIKIPVKVSGKGNLLTLSKPQIENEDGLKVIIEEKDNSLSFNGGDLTGEKNFLLTVIPQREGNINNGRIFIEYFNPYKKIYEKAESQQLSFEIEKGNVTDEKGEVRFSSDGASGVRFNYLIAGLIIAGLAIVVIALVVWERKKLKILQSELKPADPDESESPIADKNGSVLGNIEASLKNKDRELFLLNADRGINRIDQAKLSDNEAIKYEVYKEKIYNARYGGGSFAENEMHELYSWLNRNLK
jgi:hypothetical protein